MATAVAYKVVTENTGLNMRQEASESSGVITSVPKGAIVTPIIAVLDKNGFAYVNYNGQNGWCSLKYLVAVDSTGKEVVDNNSKIEKNEEEKKDCNGKAWLIAGGIIFAIGASMNIFM